MSNKLEQRDQDSEQVQEVKDNFQNYRLQAISQLTTSSIDFSP